MDRSRILSMLLGVLAGGMLAAGVLVPAADPWMLAFAGSAIGIGISASLAPVVLCVAGTAAILALSDAPHGLLLATPLVGAVLARSRTSTAMSWWGALPCLAGAALGGGGAMIAASVAWITAWIVAPGPGRPSRGLATIINTLFGQSVFVVLCLILPAAFPVMLLPGRRRLMMGLVRWGSRCILASTPTFRWYNRDQRSSSSLPSLIISNHLCVLDILAVLAVPGRRRVIVAKPWVFRSPVLGFAARHGGMVPVAHVHDPALSTRLPPDTDCVIFPEGTRSSDGRTRRFRLGAAQLAQDLGRQVSLAVHAGGWRVLRPRQLWIRPGIVVCEMRDAPPAVAGWNKAWLNQVRNEIDRAAAAISLEHLGRPLMRLDRWEANAHRGWGAALAWWRAERAQVWRLAADAGQGTWAVDDDRAGVLREALRQYRPWAESTVDQADCVFRPVPDGRWAIGASPTGPPA